MAPASTTTVSPASIVRSVGRACGLRGVRPGGDDRLEGRRVGAVLVEELVQPPGELALGAADEPLLGEARIRLARDLAGAADRIQLVVVLDRAQRLDEAAPGDEREPACAQDLPRRVADGVGLEAHGALEQLGQRRDERALRLDELDALDRPRGLGVAEVAEEPHALRLDEERRVRAREPDEVADVDAVRDEQRLLEARARDASIRLIAPHRQVLRARRGSPPAPCRSRGR